MEIAFLTFMFLLQVQLISALYINVFIVFVLVLKTFFRLRLFFRVKYSSTNSAGNSCSQTELIYAR